MNLRVWRKSALRPLPRSAAHPAPTASASCRIHTSPGIADEVEALTVEAVAFLDRADEHGRSACRCAWRRRRCGRRPGGSAGSSKSPGTAKRGCRGRHGPIQSPSDAGHVRDRVDILGTERRLDLGEVDDLRVGLGQPDPVPARGR